MKKRIVCTIIALLTNSLLNSCSKACEHDWNEANCTTPKTCVLCGETEGEPLGHQIIDGECTVCDYYTCKHNYVDATCITPKICTECNLIKGEPLGHIEENDKCNVCGIEGLFYRSDIINEIKDLKELVINEVDDDLKDKINELYNEYFIKINEVSILNTLEDIKKEFTNKMYELIPLANGAYRYNLKELDDIRYAKKLLREYGYRNNTFGIPISKHAVIHINSTTKETWEYFFGENGIVKQTEKEDYWDVKPFLSNKSFIKGLSCSIDKDMIQANTRYVDEEEVRESIYIGLDDYDYFEYDVEKARKHFKVALDEMISEGVYDISNISEPILLTIEILYDYRNTEKYSFIEDELTFNIIEKSFEDAFNDDSVTDGKFKLDVVGKRNESNTYITYYHCRDGQFDMSLGYGASLSHSGAFLRFENKCTPGQGISYSVVTNDVEVDCIVYKGERYSYDAFAWCASSWYWNMARYVENGELDHS